MNDIPEPALSFIEAGTPPRRLAVRARPKLKAVLDAHGVMRVGGYGG